MEDMFAVGDDGLGVSVNIYLTGIFPTFFYCILQ